jgi:chlorobactene glucosyltransferase
MTNTHPWHAWVLALVPLAQAWFASRSARSYRRLPVLGDAYLPGTDLPSVSIIVPARNEAHNLPALLLSLRALCYPVYECIVVDDGSEDGTALAATSSGARVVTAGPLPEGWAGKPHACYQGASAAHHQWLLFTDADTVHQPDSLARVMSLAVTEGLDALSLLCGQRCESFWERLLLPYAYRQFFAGVDARAVNDPARRETLANGQYILIRRDAYERIGGHAPVRGSIVEDVALAGVFQRAGIRYRLLRGEAAVQVRMYRNLREIRHGFAKNSSRFLADNPKRGVQVLASTLCDGGAPALLALGLLSRRRTPVLAGVLSWLVAAAGLRRWIRWFGVPTRYALLQPLTAVAFQLISLLGITALRPGGTEWKGRRY